MTPERRTQIRNGVEAARTGWRETWREMLWAVGALDEKGNPSATMFFAAALAVTVIRHQWIDAEPSWADIAQTALVAAVMFGRHTFERWLSSRQMQTRVQDVTERMDARIDVRTLPNAYADDERGL